MIKALSMIFVFIVFINEHVSAKKPYYHYAPKSHHKPPGHILDILTLSGSTVLRNKKMRALNVNGKLEFHNINVTQDAHVIGPTENSDHGKFGNLEIMGTFIASDVKTQQLKVTGNVKLWNLNVTNNTHIIGSFHATNAYLNNLYVFGSDILLTNVHVESIVIQKMDNAQRPQVLTLRGKTTVTGNITFSSGKGIIEMGPHVIIEGTISRGTIVKKIPHML